MATTVSWILPLVLLPGVALLITSASARYGQIHNELHHIVDKQDAISTTFCRHLLHRATRSQCAGAALQNYDFPLDLLSRKSPMITGKGYFRIWDGLATVRIL